MLARLPLPGEVFADDDAPSSGSRRGTLGNEAIQRAIKPHLSEVRYCFQKDAGSQNIEGRVFVRFTVSQTGAVSASEVASSTVQSPAVEKCLAGAVRRWTFPAPAGGGSAVVTHPFMMVSVQ